MAKIMIGRTPLTQKAVLSEPENAWYTNSFLSSLGEKLKKHNHTVEALPLLSQIAILRPNQKPDILITPDPALWDWNKPLKSRELIEQIEKTKIPKAILIPLTDCGFSGSSRGATKWEIFSIDQMQEILNCCAG
jgi:hypothetical protein